MKKLVCILVALFLMMPFAFAEEYVDNSNALDLSNVTIVEPKPTPNPNRHINIFVVNAKDSYEIGESITFGAELVGYEWCSEMVYQWQILQNGEWHDIGGANALEYTFTITVDNYMCEWRIKVTCYV